MFATTPAFSGFAVDDLDAARTFYGEALGVDVSVVDDESGLLSLNVAESTPILVYAKADHIPATFTVLNFPVDDVEQAVDALAAKGIEFIRYDDFDQDDKGIARGQGPPIAWFTDPAGNILSVLGADETA